MKKSFKIIAFVLGIIIAIVGVVLIFGDNYIEGKIEDGLKKLPDHVSINYESLDFSTLQGNLIIEAPKIELRDPNMDSLVATLEIENIAVKDISYWAYITNKNFIIDRIELVNPKLLYRKINMNNDSTKSNEEKGLGFKNTIKIKTIAVKDAEVEVNDYKTNESIISANSLELEIIDFLIDKSNSGLIPFKYNSYNGSVKNILYQLGNYENLEVGKITLDSHKSLLEEVSLKTKFNRSQFDQMLKEERDWYNIEIDSVMLSAYSIEKSESERIVFKLDSAIIYKPYVNVYRNKLLADEKEIKPYYSKILRDLDLDLTLYKIGLENGFISYEEKVIEGHKPGKLDFPNFYASIYNFSNTYDEGKQTTIDVKTDFMESSPLEVNWSFDYHDKDDNYMFKADLGNINTKQLNQFTNPNLNVMLEGRVNQTYFTISGNKYSSNIDLKINYDDFRVKLMNDERNKPKKLLNALVNIFVRKDSDKAKNNYREGSASIDRNKYGSIYNNIWLTLESGLKKAITGDVQNKQD